MKDKQAFKQRSTDFVALHREAVVAAVTAWAGLSPRGPVPAARTILRHPACDTLRAAEIALASTVRALLHGESMTAASVNLGKRVVREIRRTVEAQRDAVLGALRMGDEGGTGADVDAPPVDTLPTTDEDLARVGLTLLDLVATATGVIKLEARHADRPDKDEDGGVTVVLCWEIVPVAGTFAETAAQWLSTGMPTGHAPGLITPWSDQKTGGAPHQDGGLVHRADEAMAGTSLATAPALFEAINAVQAVRFTVNPKVGATLLKFDAGAAFDWHLARNIARGMDEATAKRKAREATRI